MKKIFIIGIISTLILNLYAFISFAEESGKSDENLCRMFYIDDDLLYVSSYIVCVIEVEEKYVESYENEGWSRTLPSEKIVVYNQESDVEEIPHFLFEKYEKEGWSLTSPLETIVYSETGEIRNIFRSYLELYEKRGWELLPPITMYKEYGQKKKVKYSDIENQEALGWFLDEPIPFYSLDGKVLYGCEKDIIEYEKNGWYTTKPVCVFSLDGRTLFIPEKHIKLYEAVGWDIAPPITMYSVDNRTIKVRSSEQEIYEAVGWDIEPPITMYSSDDRTIIVRHSEKEAYKKVGWFYSKPVKLYSKENKTIYVEKDEVAQYQKYGWSTEPYVELYAHAKSQKFPQNMVEAQLSVGWSYTPVGDHIWNEATCTIPKTCKVCGLKEGTTKNHEYSKYSGLCKNCGSHMLLYEGKGITIYFDGIDIDDYGDFYLKLFIKNNSSRKELIQMRETSVNGYMTKFIMSQEIFPGKLAKCYAYFPSFNFSDVGIRTADEIYEIEFKFILCESNYFLTNAISLTLY